MSAFKALKDVSKNFEEELQRVSKELFSAKIEESFEDTIAKKLRDLSVYNSKLRLLRAKPLCLNSQLSEQDHDEETILEAYGEALATRIIEQQLVKSATQAHAVHNLITASDSTLNPEMIDRKKKILAALSAYKMEEATVQGLDAVLKEEDLRLAETRIKWDKELGQLRDIRGQGAAEIEVDVNESLYLKLLRIVNKIEIMRWLAAQLGVPRSRGYDWLADPHRRLRAIKMARDHYTIQQFLDSP